MSPRRSLADRLEAFALELPEAWVDHPWDDHTVTKVGKKIFVFHGDGIGVKLPESAEMALRAPGATPMGYGMGKWGWVTVPIVGDDVPPPEVLEDWIEESYRAVATKTLVKRLDAERAS